MDFDTDGNRSANIKGNKQPFRRSLKLQAGVTPEVRLTSFWYISINWIKEVNSFIQFSLQEKNQPHFTRQVDY